MGVAVADFDNDGLLDVYVTGYGGNVLYHNLGNCKFEDVTEKAGVRGGGFSTALLGGLRSGWPCRFIRFRYVHVDINNLPEFGRDKFCRYKFWFSAVPGVSRAKVIFCFTTEVTAL